MLYFSYGSNMSSRRLKKRVTATKLGMASLQQYRLRFHKFGQLDNSGKCDVEETGNTSDVVFGVLFEIAASEKQKLDRIEGLGSGYAEKIISVIHDGESVQALTYYATNIDPSLKPLHWYKEHVLRGARENKLPAAYIQQIEAVESIADQDRERHERELAIYS